MRNRLTLAASLAALIHLAGPARAEADDGVLRRAPLPFFRSGPNGPEAIPGLPGLKGPLPSGRPAFGPDGAADAPPPLPGTDSAAKPGRDAAQPPARAPTRAESIDRLLGRLAKAEDADEAKGIAGLVERLWMQSGSDTADLLMERAVTAMNGDRHDVASALLDGIIALQPGWAEAWNKRATLRFLDGDDMGSMEDISHVLALEPRHFGALSGMGFILARHGDDKAALTAMRRALAVYPGDADLRKAAEKLVPTVEGQDL